jgi:hypothetical protein
MNSFVSARGEEPMSRQVELNGRQFWILSEPNGGPVWKSTMMEVTSGGTPQAVGIDATAETRAAGDDAAERELRRMVNAQR